MDDKSYFQLKCDYLPENDHYFTSDKSTKPNDIKFRTQKKFSVQLMVWICLSEDAVCELVFLERPNSINGEFYRENCIKGKLVEFIEENHSQDDYIFWSDLASAHYAKDTVELFEELKIPYVLKDQNHPNVPQCRPIENFWSILKTKVYGNEWEATNILQLKRKIKKCLKEIDLSCLHNDFSRIGTNLRKIYRNNPFCVV